MNRERYFIASSEVAEKVNALDEKRREYFERCEKLAKKLGGARAVYFISAFSGEEMCGVVFKSASHPGAGWRKKAERTEEGSKFYRPLLSTKTGKQIGKEMSESTPSNRDYNDIVGLRDHELMTASGTGRGLAIRSAYHNVLADTLVFIVPVAEGGKIKSIDMELLTEISKADYLELQAKHERQKEAA